MANNTIYFKGVKYKAGTTEGWRPSFVAQNAVDEQELAEKVCLECGLAMSPSELMMGFRSVLERAPQYVAADGRTRQVNNLMKWYASATGNLDSEGGAWNDTCKGSVKVSLLKAAKATLAGPFANVNATEGAKIDNVTWIGAESVINIVKPGQPFAAYGRNMQFDATKGDTAKLTTGQADHPLTCTASDAAHAVFAWPTGYNPEPGTRVTFVLHSRGGVEGGAFTDVGKVVTTIDGTVPLPCPTGHTEDNKLVVTATKDGNQWQTFTFGHTWTLDGTGLFGRGGAPEGMWYIADVAVQAVSGAENPMLNVACNAEGTHVTLTVNSQQPVPPSGQYREAELQILCMNADEEMEVVQIPINLVVP